MPMAVEVDTSERKVAEGLLDVRPKAIEKLFGERLPRDFTVADFTKRALAALDRPCGCLMCRGAKVLRTPKQVENLRLDLKRSKFKRAVIFCRDGWRCVECSSTHRLTIDHKLGLARGGTNAYHNLQVLCESCHVLKPDSHSPRFLARHLANLIDDVFHLIQPTNTAELARVNRVRRFIDNIRSEGAA